MIAVTDPTPDFDSSPSEAELPPPPATGVELIDNALAAIDLGGDVTEHPAQLAAAVDLLQHVLRNPPEQ